MYRTNRIPNGAAMNIARLGKEIPLNIILLIVDYIHDVPTLAAVTRTSKLLYYMTLPRLYEHVCLRSYPTIRMFDGLPEGYGSGSPFSMALNGLVTQPVAVYVKSWRLCGEWREEGAEEFRAGRVPDSVIMLNTVVRAGMERMENLQKFSWQLTTKPLLPVYAGLALRKTLTSLTIHFPSSRTPRPTVLIPPIPSLISFSAIDIDPLCYPDDISLLLLGSKKLQNLTLVWSPRMRREGESSVHLNTYFGRCTSAGHKITLRRLSLKNLYAPNDPNFESAFNTDDFRVIEVFNCMNLWDPTTAFIDDTWRFKGQRKVPKSLKCMRSDSLDKGHVEFISAFPGLEELYMVTPQRKVGGSGSDSSTPSSSGAFANGASLDSPRPFQPERISVSLASDYIAAITSHHGATLRALLLSEHFSLSTNVLSRLIASCPRLEQIGVALEEGGLVDLRKALIKIQCLKAFRVLVPRESEYFIALSKIPAEGHAFPLSLELYREQYKTIHWFGMGDFVYKLGKNVKVGEQWRRSVIPATMEDVKDIEIWGKDNVDLE